MANRNTGASKIRQEEDIFEFHYDGYVGGTRVPRLRRRIPLRRPPWHGLLSVTPDGSAALYRDGTLYDTTTGDVLATIGESLGGTTHLTDGIAYQADHGQDRSIVLLPGG